MKRRNLVKTGFILLFIGITGIFFLKQNHIDEQEPLVLLDTSTKEEQETEQESVETKQEEETPGIVVVHVCGAVKKEGVYTLPLGSRVADAINMAGGLTKDAKGSAINQAQCVVDGSRIYVPTQDEVAFEEKETGTSQSEFVSKETKISINRAGKEELMQLPGVGAAKADSILAYRQEHGYFQTIEDLMKVPGIKSGVYEKIRDKISIE